MVQLRQDTYICAEARSLGLPSFLCSSCAYITFLPLDTSTNINQKSILGLGTQLTHTCLTKPTPKQNGNGKPTRCAFCNLLTTPPTSPNPSPSPLKVHRRQRAHTSGTLTTNTNLELAFLSHPLRNGRPRSRQKTLSNFSPFPQSWS